MTGADGHTHIAGAPEETQNMQLTSYGNIVRFIVTGWHVRKETSLIPRPRITWEQGYKEPYYTMLLGII